MKTYFSLLAATMLMATTVAHAETSTDWTGFSIGANATHSKFKSDIDEDTGFSFLGVFSGEPDSSDTSWGGFAGYDYEFANKLVLGGEVNYSKIDAKGTQAIGNALVPIDATAELNDMWTFRMKLGYDMNRFLPYVFAGYAIADQKLTATGSGLTNSNEETLHGVNMGLGVNMKIAGPFVARAEYDYTNFASKNYGDFVGSGSSTDSDADLHKITLGIGAKF